MKVFTIPLYRCSNCGYQQDFQPDSEICANCRQSSLNQAATAKVTVAEDSDIDARDIPKAEKDALKARRDAAWGDKLRELDAQK